MAIAYVTQTTAAKLLSELWASQPEYAVNNSRGVVSTVWDTGETYFGPGYKVHIPIIGTIAASSFAGTGAIDTSVANTETEAVLTPTVKYTAVYIPEDVSLTTAYDTVRAYTPALAEGLHQQIDIDILSLYGDFTSNTSTDAADFTAATFHGLVAKMLSNGGDKVQLGQLHGWYHPLKWDAIMTLGDFNSAAVRGENNGPAKTGSLGMAFGVNFHFTKNVQTSTTLRNLIFSPKSVVLVRKNRPKVEMHREDLITKVVASTMYAVDSVHEASGGEHRITATT